METVYEKYKSASEYLMEYYTWVDLLGIERREFEEHAEAIEKHCKRLYANFEKAAAEERKREENSKSARIAKKLEQIPHGSSSSKHCLINATFFRTMFR